MHKNKSIVIIGATSAIAEHCARIWASQCPADFILIARDEVKASRIAADLQVRSPESRVRIIMAEFLSSQGIQAAVDAAESSAPIDIALIAHGSLPDQRICESELTACDEALQVNGVSPVLFAEALVKKMAAVGKGTLGIIGSVAGDRGRRSNYAYGAAKGLVARYAQGLQHRFSGSPIRIILIKPGPTETPMTAHLTADGARMAPVQDVAKAIVDAINRGRSETIYAPEKWAIIMQILRHIPPSIFNKLKI